MSHSLIGNVRISYPFKTINENYEKYQLNIVQVVALQNVGRDCDAKQMLIEET